MNQQTNNKAREIEVTADDLPLHCPMPSMILKISQFVNKSLTI